MWTLRLKTPPVWRGRREEQERSKRVEYSIYAETHSKTQLLHRVADPFTESYSRIPARVTGERRAHLVWTIAGLRQCVHSIPFHCLAFGHTADIYSFFPPWNNPVADVFLKAQGSEPRRNDLYLNVSGSTHRTHYRWSDGGKQCSFLLSTSFFPSHDCRILRYLSASSSPSTHHSFLLSFNLQLLQSLVTRATNYLAALMNFQQQRRRDGLW